MNKEISKKKKPHVDHRKEFWFQQNSKQFHKSYEKSYLKLFSTPVQPSF